MFTVDPTSWPDTTFSFTVCVAALAGKRQVYSMWNFHPEVSASRSWLSRQAEYLNDKLLLQTEMSETGGQTPLTHFVRPSSVPGAAGRPCSPVVLRTGSSLRCTCLRLNGKSVHHHFRQEKSRNQS